MRLDIAHGIPEFGHYLHTLARNVPRAGRRLWREKEQEQRQAINHRL